MAKRSKNRLVDEEIAKLERALTTIENEQRLLEDKRRHICESLERLFITQEVLASLGSATDDNREESIAPPPGMKVVNSVLKGLDYHLHKNEEQSKHVGMEAPRRRIRMPGKKHRKRKLSEIIMEFFERNDAVARASDVFYALQELPEVNSPASINTTLSRLAKDGKLVSTSKGYALPKKEKPDAATSGSSGAHSKSVDEADADPPVAQTGKEGG